MGCRLLTMLVMMVAALAGPQRCCCGIRAVAAAVPACASAECCSCCDACAEAPDGPTDAVACEAGPAGDHRSEDTGCPVRGKPRQAWDSAGDGQAVKFRPGPAVTLSVGVVPSTGRLLTTAHRGPPRSPGERSALGGRGLLLLLQILRC